VRFLSLPQLESWQGQEQALPARRLVPWPATPDVTDTVIDAMLRPRNVGQAAPAGAARHQCCTSYSRGAASRRQRRDPRAEIARILASSVASGSITLRTAHITQLVAQRTGISQQEAERRVNKAVNAARDAADKARHGAILVGFVTAAKLIISLGAGWWTAMRGGQHRDTSSQRRYSMAGSCADLRARCPNDIDLAWVGRLSDYLQDHCVAI
jgi:hypothetical protein